MIRVALGQLNFTVGDIEGNVRRSIEAIEGAREAGAQVLALPELALTGYPPEDLVMKKSFVAANRRALREVAARSDQVLVVAGFVDESDGKLYNAAAMCQSGEVVGVYRKQVLPNYGVFDEYRHFQPGRGHVLIDTPQGVLGVCVCEDVWYDDGPAISQADAGAQVILNINASPFHKGKLEERTAMLAQRARRGRASIVYVNCVGGQDELVFDGGSLVIDPEGRTVARLPQFVEELAIVDVPLGATGTAQTQAVVRVQRELAPTPAPMSPAGLSEILPAEEEIYEALKLALRDYVDKNGFVNVVMGLSGGIDSTLVATIAADALGPERVLGVAMPSEFSSSHSVDDAKQLAQNLGMELLQIPIARPYHAYLETLDDAFGRQEAGTAEENLQARIRGNVLMAISNRYGHLVIATGNKSEMACGYATLYGDMAGGFALLKDVFKLEVYSLARWRNTQDPVIPDNVLVKPPSAELRPGQKDTDSLPEYSVLDPILEAYIERDAGVEELAADGHPRDVVERVITLVDRAEYKRRQAPPGPKVTTKAFGRDRRLPITNRWLERPGEAPPETGR